MIVSCVKTTTNLNSDVDNLVMQAQLDSESFVSE